MGSSLSDEEYYDSPDESATESGVFWNKDFESVCRQLETEELSELSKAELVRECLQLREDEKNWQQSQQEAEEMGKRLADLEEDNKRLREENAALQRCSMGH